MIGMFTLFAPPESSLFICKVLDTSHFLQVGFCWHPIGILPGK
jgi:hypothetical protein